MTDNGRTEATVSCDSTSQIAIDSEISNEKPSLIFQPYVNQQNGTTKQEQAYEVKDGGFRAWATVIGGWIIVFTTFGSSNSFGVFQDLYTLEGTSSTSNISWIGSTQLFLMFTLSLLSGKFFDLGYFHQAQTAGIVIYLISIYMLSLVDTSKFYQIFLAQGLGVGTGVGLMFLPALAIQSHHWKKRRALAMGLVTTGSSFGGVIYPIMMNQLLHHSTLGFAKSVRAMAYMDTGLLLLAKLLMSTNRPPARESVPKPNIRAILTDVPYMLAVIGAFFTILGLFFPYFYLQLFMNLKGLDTTLAFYSLAIMNAASIPGRTIPNLLADHYGHLNMLAPMILSAGILIFAILGIASNASAVVFAMLYGFFSGAYLSMLPPAMAALSKDVSEVGIRMGVGFFIPGLAHLAGNPVNGALLKNGYPWWKPIVWSGTNIIGGAALLIVARQLLVKRNGTQRV